MIGFKLHENHWLVRTAVWSFSRLRKVSARFVKQDEPALLSYLSERIVEYPFVLSKLKGYKVGKVLDVGCVDSRNVIPFMLASLSWQVYGLDIQEFGFKHPKFTFVCEDIAKGTHFADDFFDCVYSISTLEHIGIKGSFGINEDDIQGDKKAVKEISRILRAGGTFLVTLPFGKERRIRSRRYDETMLSKLISGWQILDEVYYIHDSERGWITTSKEIAGKAGYSADEEKAIVMLELVTSK